MSLRKKEIISALQQQPTLLRDYPWYPTGYLAQKAEHNNIHRLAAFVNHPLRVHLLVSDDEVAGPLDIATIVDTTERIKNEATANISELVPEPETSEVEEAVTTNETEAVTEHTEEMIVVEPESAIVTTASEVVESEEKPLVLPTISIPTSTDESLLFQPFHTVDYFASQGIKADQSAITTTRFDTQLKSFSQWLKTMKRADYQTGQFSTDPAVEAQAKASLEVKEVVTEAMADVLAQQGRHAQAIEVYRKLTLLHPEKSAFFAAQIEKLKA